MDSYTQDMLNTISRSMTKSAFEDFDAATLASMSDKDLAAWHADQSADSAQFILATHEWNRRLLAAELRSIRFATWAGIVATLGGVALGAFLTKLLG
jgi:hypothetical protein